MLDKTSVAGLKDSEETFGKYDHWSQAIPVSWSEWGKIPHRKGGKPRGLSVNRGRKWEQYDD